VGADAEAALRVPGIQGEVPPGASLPRAGRMSLGRVPAGFDLERVVMSHGWCQLAPTAYDEPRRVLHRTLDLPDAGPLTVSVRESRGGLEASWGRVKGTCDDRIAVKAALRRMLAVDVDLTELYEHCARVPSLRWVPASGLGRLVRSPTVFEDLAKTLATTNCSWALTKLMCRRIVDSLGAEGPEGERAFPAPEAFVRAGERHFADVVRAGYRSRAFVALAASYDALDVARWEDPAYADADVLRDGKALRGFGPYAAEGMLGLLGRPRGLAIDSWVRAKLPGLLGRDAMTDAEIAGHFAPLGRWAGAGLWLELTRDWFGL
jgi:3-methyladenine DNA glycosylase/8-oxoguanine DNA glycosylase